MGLDELRRTVILAIFADELLMEELVLKGGNALSLVYGFGTRSSINVDLSIENDFTNVAEVKKRLFATLRERFRSKGFILFDESLKPQPPIRGSSEDEKWGGYEVVFKMIDQATFESLGGDLEEIRRNATVVSPYQRRTFRIQISKFEYCAAKAQRVLEGRTISVYTPAMIALEKLRALCQQMPEYPFVRHKRARARDFYDIYCIVNEGTLNLGTASNLELARNIFAAKNVPLRLIARIADHREFHRQDWPAVESSVSGELRGFDFYFDFVMHEIERLKPLWEE